MWTWFKDFLYTAIEFFTQYTGDWGLAIIIVTIILRLILLPITLRQQKSMAHMQQLQPKLKALQERYKDDPQRMNAELMKFYSENKFNPAAGCIPMFIQLPVFLALFQVLKDQIHSDASFLNIFSNLTISPQYIVATDGIFTAIPAIIMVLLFSALTLLPMWLQKSADNNMKMISGVMGVMMLYFGWISPIGVLLYWDASALWGLVQQLIITKRVENQAALEESKAKEWSPVEVNVVRHNKSPRPRKKK